MENGALAGLSGGYVEELLRAGSPSIRKMAEKTRNNFDMGVDETLSCALAGFISLVTANQT